MPGDYTRFTFDPRSDYAGVFKQQGRVDLDADFNELVDIIDRRWRSETIDVIGHGTVPRVPPATPPALDPFLVIPTAMGQFDIGIGRMYVDGIQVANHGRPPLDYRADLGEQRGTVPVPYADQPYLPAPLPPTLAAAPGTTDLIYIDVWQREVTALEDPTLREIALGGPDTTTRMQAVWQVRALQNVGTHGCGDDIDVWDRTIATSAGRLTVTAVAPPSSDDPCILSPSGGYRGLENRLYRIEIHTVGTVGGAGPAKFKWSRDNANVAASVTAIPAATQIKVQQLGRDQVLRFAPGNWIEITDDFRELSGLTGHMAQIQSIDEANRTIAFTPPIPGAITFNAADAARHTRVRRWDQSQNVDANGLLDVTAGPIDIEDGVRVEFSLDPAAGGFKVGDWWAFAARTADGSVEALTRSPPRGILHHYCRLGFVHWGPDLAGTTFTDCRVRWPHGDCDCCTVTVGDGIDSHGQFTDIQQAIDALGNRGGIVCIGRGFYRVTRGLVLNATKRNVIIRGMGPATRIVFVPDRESPRVFLDIRGTEHVRLENVFVASARADSLLRVVDSQFCRVEDCILVNLPGEAGDDARAPRIVDFARGCSHCVIARSALVAPKAVTATEAALRELQLRDNLILALQVAVLIAQGEGIEIIHNQIRGLPREALVPGAELTRDTIDAFQRQISQALRAATTFGNLPAAGVLIFTGRRVVIAQNLISAHVAVFGFLFINLRVHQNDIVSLVGVLLLFGLRVKLEDNFVLGLFTGLVQAGIAVDVDCTSNEWLGLHGIIWMSAAELARVLAPLLGAVVNTTGIAARSSQTLGNIMVMGNALVGTLAAIGVVLIAKVHRNVFLTFARGIYKTDSVLSVDVSIVDNTFSLCSLAAIELGGGGRDPRFLAAVRNGAALRHLVQGNAIVARGKGVVSSSVFTEVADNDIQSVGAAVELDAALCTVRNNLLLGIVEPPAPEDAGLIVLHAAATQATIVRNRIIHAPGHAILIRDDLLDLTVEDNEIDLARGFGIGTFRETTRVRRVRIVRNRVQSCAGEIPEGFRGAIRMGSSDELRFADNIVVENAPVPGTAQFLLWSAVYFGEVDDLDMTGNRITDNVPPAGFTGLFAAIRMQEARGPVQLQNNVVRGNGGSVLEIYPVFFKRDAGQRILIQNNHFTAGARPTPILLRVIGADTLLFQNNRCAEESPGAFIWPITLGAEQANVSGNVVTARAPAAMAVRGTELIVNGNSVGPGMFTVQGFGAARVIVTSNLCNLLSAGSTGTLIRIHNLPPP